jgi:hypothetical protein
MLCKRTDKGNSVYVVGFFFFFFLFFFFFSCVMFGAVEHYLAYSRAVRACVQHLKLSWKLKLKLKLKLDGTSGESQKSKMSMAEAKFCHHSIYYNPLKRAFPSVLLASARISGRSWLTFPSFLFFLLVSGLTMVSDSVSKVQGF